MRIGIAHHLGWAVAVTATDGHQVIDRRRIELIEPGLPAAPIHHEGGAHELHRTGPELDDGELAALVDAVQASVLRTTRVSLDRLVADLGAAVTSVSVRDWPDDLPSDIAALRRPPLEARVDSYRYCQIIAEVTQERGWAVHRYDARQVEAQAVALLGSRADEVLHGQRRTLGAPWAKDHRVALAATVVAASAG